LILRKLQDLGADLAGEIHYSHLKKIELSIFEAGN